MEDQQLIQALQNGEENAFKEVVNSYQLVIYNTCMGMLHDEVLAQDISQEVFIELHRSIDKFRGDSKLSTWLYRIAINKSLNELRSRKRHQKLRSIQRFFGYDSSMEWQPEDTKGLNAEQQFEQQENSQALQSALDKLPENQKTAFVLKNYDQLSYKEIAEVMQLSISAVESLIHRARLNLQGSLQAYYDRNFNQ
jgi:RNA polymerase sigma-70 factor (ECF subfamily)